MVRLHRIKPAHEIKLLWTRRKDEAETETGMTLEGMKIAQSTATHVFQSYQIQYPGTTPSQKGEDWKAAVKSHEHSRLGTDPYIFEAGALGKSQKQLEHKFSESENMEKLCIRKMPKKTLHAPSCGEFQKKFLHSNE